MPETTQKTAMQILRDRLQAEIEFIRDDADIRDTYARQALRNTIKLIDTELLAVEKQQIVDAFNLGRDCTVRATVDAGLHYFETTFNPK